MPHLIDVMPILFMVCSAATLIFVFALLIYSTFASDSDFANKKISIVLFRLLIASALAALAFGFASILVILIENRRSFDPSLLRQHTLYVLPGAFTEPT